MNPSSWLSWDWKGTAIAEKKSHDDDPNGRWASHHSEKATFVSGLN